MIHPIRKADFHEHRAGQRFAFLRCFVVFRATIVYEREHDITQGSGARKQVIRLKNKADLLVADGGQFFVVQVAYIL